MSTARADKPNVQSTGPYRSLRDYIAALEARGRLLRVQEMDQDEFEATAFAYRLTEKYGIYDAPAFLIERIKIAGTWRDGPIISNLYGGWDMEAQCFGVADITNNQREMYKVTLKKLKGLSDHQGTWPKQKPKTVTRQDAPCKEVIVLGDDVDLFRFPWLKSNPGDAGQYINTGAVILEDPELGRNVAINRCQIKGKRKIGINIKGQDGWVFLMTKKRRGEKVADAAVVLGTDPLVYAMSGSKLAGLGEDELEVAGGLAGKPIEIVKCETSNLRVPAEAEMIIEGTIPLDDKEAEGPFAEVYGYMGPIIPQNFYMNVEAITHRTHPWFINAFSGATKLHHTIPSEADEYFKQKKNIPNLVAVHSPPEARGVVVLSIDKNAPGDGMTAGMQAAASSFFSKAIVIVDKDIDVTSLAQVFHAMGARWQPNPASVVIPQARGTVLDPSTPQHRLTSKMIIDATRQFPEEGGPDPWPALSRHILKEQNPGAFEMVDAKWDDYWTSFQGTQ